MNRSLVLAPLVVLGLASCAYALPSGQGERTAL
jgi:hypothetical protein